MFSSWKGNPTQKNSLDNQQQYERWKNKWKFKFTIFPFVKLASRQETSWKIKSHYHFTATLKGSIH